MLLLLKSSELFACINSSDFNFFLSFLLVLELFVLLFVLNANEMLDDVLPFVTTDPFICSSNLDSFAFGATAKLDKLLGQ